MDRIKKLRDLTLDFKIRRDEFNYLFYKYYNEMPYSNSAERYGNAFYHAFSNLTPQISDGEIIVGEAVKPIPEEYAAEWKEKYEDIAYKGTQQAGDGQDSHMAIDYPLLLSEGINGIIARIDGYMAKCEKEKLPFYKTAKRCLEAVVCHSNNYASLAEKMAGECEDEKRRAELLMIAENCRKVPAGAAESFLQALQSVHFVTFCLTINPFRPGDQQFQLGHPDRYLLPYYEKDIASGALTREEAMFYLDLLGIQINMRVPNGLSSGYMVGGRDAEGNIVQNELTEMLMQVIDDIKLVYPAVGLCYTEGMDKKYLRKACEILSHGCSHPAIFNDDIIVKGLLEYGLSNEEAHDYIHSTCVEITPVALSNVWVASPYHNMPQFLLDIMDREYDNFEALMERYYERLDRAIKEEFEKQNENRKTRLHNSMNPLLSCFVHDCLEKGLDIEHGGARYNWIMTNFVGMANLVDSLYALKKIVFEEKEYSICGLKAILDSNFEGNEALRLRLLSKIDKYGNDIDEIDSYFVGISEHLLSECKKYEGMFDNGQLIPSIFCWIMHEYFGRKTSATPDGRCAGFPLGDGSGPCQGREMNGPTASILSSTKWDHHSFIGGIAVNMKFSKNSLGENSIKTMEELVLTYLSRGGFEMQINVVDKATLLDAVQNPEAHRDLVVRIGGYSDYFTRLSSHMQSEVILRTEHQI